MSPLLAIVVQWGRPAVKGGEAALPARNTRIDTRGERHPLAGQHQLRVTPGDRIEVQTPGGGGWGEPPERTPQGES